MSWIIPAGYELDADGTVRPLLKSDDSGESDPNVDTSRIRRIVREELARARFTKHDHPAQPPSSMEASSALVMWATSPDMREFTQKPRTGSQLYAHFSRRNMNTTVSWQQFINFISAPGRSRLTVDKTARPQHVLISPDCKWIKPVSYTHLTLPTTPYV